METEARSAIHHHHQTPSDRLSEMLGHSEMNHTRLNFARQNLHHERRTDLRSNQLPMKLGLRTASLGLILAVTFFFVLSSQFHTTQASSLLSCSRACPRSGWVCGQEFCKGLQVLANPQMAYRLYRCPNLPAASQRNSFGSSREDSSSSRDGDESTFNRASLSNGLHALFDELVSSDDTQSQAAVEPLFEFKCRNACDTSTSYCDFVKHHD